MQYHEAVGFLQDLRRFRSKPGTESTRELLAHLGDPHDGPTYVQIAGSNGKGSTARMVESICRSAGYEVGLYTSPHLQELRERIRVNDRLIPETQVAEFVSTVRPYLTDRAARGEPATFFETVTAMALWHFGRRNVDVAVLEVGIGGRLDATSVVSPTASAVTSVSLEHTDLLGETVEEIARDKASVAPSEAPLVTAASGSALDAIRSEAADVLTVGDDDAAVTARYTGRVNDLEGGVALSGEDWEVESRVPILGEVQARNAGVAAVLARQVGVVSESAIDRGLRSAYWPGRVEVVARDPITILDGAHNPGAIEALEEAVTEFAYEDCHVVFGAMHEKDHRGMVEGLPETASVQVCRAETERAADPGVLTRVFEHAGREATVAERVPDAVEQALDRAGEDDMVLVTGSLSVVGEARPRWTQQIASPNVDTETDARALLERTHVPDNGTDSRPGTLVSETIQTTLRPRTARALAEAFREAGGTVSISALAEHAEDAVSVVFSGTLGAFRALPNHVDHQGPALGRLATELRDRAVGEIRPAVHAAEYPWSGQTAVMGILNVTPDSFHDGGEYEAREDAVARAESMVAEGADIVDVGGESTRPGADVVPVQEEIARVVPVIESIADLDVSISIDTRKARVAEAALTAGADIINDVSGLADPTMRFVAADQDVPIVVMHSISTPVDPDAEPTYDDVVTTVREELAEPVHHAIQAGLEPEQILVDPGLGFGKSAGESFELLDRLEELRALGCPVLIGHSQKSMFEAAAFGEDERTIPTTAATALAAERGADVVRVHDVRENVAAVRTVEATRAGSSNEVE